jgi:dienelactone hydrolase
VRDLRTTLTALLGGGPHVARRRALEVTALEERRGYRLETLSIEGPGGADLPALFTRPEHGTGPFPAVLYLHAHGNRHDIGKRELIEGRPALLSPYAADLAERGIAALCLDMPTFGERASETESIAAKRHLWRGTTLFGHMLRDAQIGLDVLSERTDVDPARLGAFGISMGATHAFWLAALDDRVRSVAHLLAFADLAWLLDHGAFDLHGLYMVVPGLVGQVSTGAIAGAIAPRPQLCGVGLKDPLTPPAAVDVAAAELADAYAAAGATDRLTLLREPEAGHRETKAMRQRVLDHMTHTLAATGQSS